MYPENSSEPALTGLSPWKRTRGALRGRRGEILGTWPATAALTLVAALLRFSYVAHHHSEPGGLGERLRGFRDVERDLLWSFVGTVSTAPRVRGKIAGLTDERAVIRDTQRWSDVVRWHWLDSHREEADRAFSDYAGTLLRSKFVVCPRGAGTSSIRLFEALELGRCPVIVSDDWLPPPFVDWEACSVRVAESDIARLPAVLREREPDADRLGRRARKTWERFFSPERMLGTLAAACLEINERGGRRAGRRTAVAARALISRPALRHAKVSAQDLARR